MRSTILLPAVLLYHCCAAQQVIGPGTLHCAEGATAVHVTPLHSDSLASSFLICVDSEVNAHFHRAHTEHVFVLEGTATFVTGGKVVGGEMTAPGEIRGAGIEGGETRKLVQGDLVIVPQGTPHWFKEVKAPFNYYVVKSLN